MKPHRSNDKQVLPLPAVVFFQTSLYLTPSHPSLYSTPSHPSLYSTPSHQKQTSSHRQSRFLDYSHSCISCKSLSGLFTKNRLRSIRKVAASIHRIESFADRKGN